MLVFMPRKSELTPAFWTFGLCAPLLSFIPCIKEVNCDEKTLKTLARTLNWWPLTEYCQMILHEVVAIKEMMTSLLLRPDHDIGRIKFME